MKLFYDARHIRTDYPDGISRYSSELLGALHKLQPVTAIIHDKKQLEVIPADIDFIITHKPSSPRELFMARVLNHYEPDVVFSPMQIMGAGQWGRKYHLILTVHDLIYYEYNTPPANFNPLIRAVWWLYHQSYWPERLLLNRADVIAAVSQATKQQIKQHHLTRRPVRVVSNAPAALSANAETRQAKTKKKNLVFMGSFMAYKNVETLIGALFFLPHYQLHCLSPISASRKQELLALAPPNQLFFHNGVTDEQYAAILSSAHALVTASYSEGFGLPLIEAMRAGTPVICSDIPIFHEVAGEAGLYFDPDNQTQFTKQVVALEDSKLRTSFVKKGHEQAKKFSWGSSAKSLLKAIQDFTV